MKKLRNLSWKQKNRLLLSVFVLGLWIIYAFAISNTLESRATCAELELKLDSASDAPAQIAELRVELSRLEALSGSTDNAGADSASREKLLDLVTGYCEKNSLALREFAPSISYQQQQWLVITHPFSIEGNFEEVVLFLDYLRKNASGKIVSADIHTKRDNKTKTTALLVTVYVQNILTPSS